MIGVFDSGIGGLTILRELLRALPECGFVYLGDTARTPYGTKGPETVRRFALEDAGWLVARGARVLVVACGTMSTVAASALREAFPDVPLIEVMTPAVAEAVAATRNGVIGVLGTRATVASGAYDRAVTRCAAAVQSVPTFHDREKWGHSPRVVSCAAQILVSFVEEGMADTVEARAVLRRALAPIQQAGADTVILACTHFPFFADAAAKVLGPSVTIVDPAHATARAARAMLDGDPALAAMCRGTARTIAVTDRTPHFHALASMWLGMEVELGEVSVGERAYAMT